MEFTVGGRIRRRGRAMLGTGVLGTAGALVWLVVVGPPGPGAELFGPMGLFVVLVAAGLREIARSRRPFRLRVDGFGITLRDAELGWEQIDAVALDYTDSAVQEDDRTRAEPRLRVWPAAGTTLPRTADRTVDARLRYTVVDTADLDQDISTLAGALARHAGARFETAPRAVRTPTPVTVSGPESRVPGPARSFTARGTGVRVLAWLAAAAALTVPLVPVLATGRQPDPQVLSGLWVIAAAVSWCMVGRAVARALRPLRLRVGPEGIAVRQFVAREQRLRWSDIAAVTVGPRLGAPGKQRWLIVWPVPGTHLDTLRPDVVDGHQAVPLVRLDLLPGGEEAVAPAVRAYAGERFGR